MDSGLQKILANHKTTSNDYTHLSYSPSSKWSIPSTKLSEFYSTYCRLISENPQGNYYLGEKKQNEAPICLKFTLRFEDKSGLENLYNSDFITSVVFYTQQAISEFLHISDSKLELICCVLEPEEAYTEAEVVCIQIALQFPLCCCDLSIQSQSIRSKLVQLLRNNRVSMSLAKVPINEWDNALENISNDWPLYGSTTSPGQAKLTQLTIYQNLDGAESAETIELAEIFTPLNHSDVSEKGVIPSEMFINNGEIDYQYWLPLFLSMSYCRGVTLPKGDVMTRAIASESLNMDN